MRYRTLKYSAAGRIARITLNRPARLNAIDDRMPREIRRAVEAANADDQVHVIVLTGDTVDGTAAEKMGLVYQAVPRKDLDRAVDALAKRMAGVPKNQLMMQKLMINQAYENMGLASTQAMATLFDGITRHSPEGAWFKRYAEQHGFHEAVAWRDGGKPIPEGVPAAGRRR